MRGGLSLPLHHGESAAERHLIRAGRNERVDLNRRICAVIAEYDPFHNGHLYHLRQARALSGADVLLAVMSGYYTQRGDPALFDPLTRAEAALRCGADIVLMMPAYLTVRPAEEYARNAVSLIAAIPGVRSLAFGAECADMDLLRETAARLDEEAEAAVRVRVRNGQGIIRATEDALRAWRQETAEIIRQPNNILAVSYLRALRGKSGIEPLAIARTHSYHALTGGEMSSASSLRAAFLRGDWQALRAGTPPEACRLISEAALRGDFCPPDAADRLLLLKLTREGPQALRSLPDVAEGIENRIAAAAKQAVSRQQILEMCRGAHFTRARINRILCHALLGLHASSFRQRPCVRLLGFRKRASDTVKTIEESLPVAHSYREMKEKGALCGEELWQVCSGQRLDALEKQRMIVFDDTDCDT